MGTRCLTVFKEDDGNEIAVLYRQMDGYPDGHGQELADYLKEHELVNGIRDRTAKVFNGMGCLAAATVAHFKGEEAGNFYLHAAGTRDCGEEFIYTVYPKGGKIWIKVQAGSVTFFGMPGTKQDNMPSLFDGPVADYDAKKCDEVHAEVRKEIPNDFVESQKTSSAAS